MNVGVIGLGKLGLPMAAVFASKGHQVVGLDANANYVAKLQKGECPIQETSLEKLLKTVEIKFTVDYKTLVKESKLIFVIVPTPSTPDSRFSNDYINSVITSLNEIKPTLSTLVVIVSTVMPGSMEKFRRLLSHAYGLCYNPEFIALGSVIRDMLNPDSILIGEEGPGTGRKLEVFYSTIHEAPVYRMSYWNAELSKLALNIAVTTKISLINTLAQVCEQIPGGNIDTVAEFLGSDSRIGPKYLMSGLGFGGPCFPRDNRAFIVMAKELGITNCPIQQATIAVNDELVCRAAHLAKKMSKPCEVVSILGITYKPNTSIIEESKALKLAIKLSANRVVRVCDPQWVEETNPHWDEETNPQYYSTVEECLKDSSLCIIATPWNEFKTLDLSGMTRKVVLDCWRILENKQDCEVYKALGVNS